MHSRVHTIIGCLSLGLATICQAFFVPKNREDIPFTAFDWTTVESSQRLTFQKCYHGTFECAKLVVPLDWNDPSNPNNISIAIVRLPAVVDRADESYGGAIIVNPGGPGGSGTDIMLASGKSLQRLVDSEKHFDILSFDPRGIKYTTPNVACFNDDAARQALAILGIGAGGLDGFPDALNVKWGIDQGLGQLCQYSGYFEDGSNIRQFVSTALVARDMVEIIDRLDENRKIEVNKGKHLEFNQQQKLSEGSNEDVPLLNYWGLSYGSYLGNTFASMFPERVGRVILDGVVDAYDYAATGWTSNLRDNAKTWSKFFEYCFQAGPKCALYDPSYQSPNDIRDHVDAFLERLKEEPIPLIVGGNAALVTHYILRTSLHVALYFPNNLWPLLAQWLRALDNGDSLTASSIIEAGELWQHQKPRKFSPSLPPIPNLPGFLSMSQEDLDQASQTGYSWQLEAAVSILCGDGDDITTRTKANHTDYLALLESQSELSAPIWAEITLHCIHWPKSLRPSSKNRFTGPFASKKSDYDPKGSPILFIGNTADPVTPVHNAHKMSKEHEGSVVLTQDVPGHCSTENNPSTCLFPIVRAFFANGTLPERNLVCEGIKKPWDFA
jgi:pimeloyl-ACP methyl ester carboxylesterase